LLQVNSSTVVLAFLGGIACIAILVVVVIVPLLTRFAGTVEAVTLLMEGLGEYFGNARVVWLGCVIIVLTFVGCCIVGIVGGGVLLSCFTTNPAQLCRLIGR
jgi:Na+/pantothenate symporter